MHQNPDFRTLLDRYLEGRCTSEEEALLARFFERSGEPEKQVYLSDQDQARMFMAFRDSPRFREQPAKRNLMATIRSYRLWKVAVWQAAAVLLLLLGFWSWDRVSRSGKMIAYKQISNPKGAVSRVVLPDSSVVILNANSTLSYAEDFSRHRELKLTGEALFDVSRDQAHPFIIHTAGGIQTKVLGTSFTIRSYDNLPETQIMVISGRIQVQHANTVLGILGRNERVIYNRSGGSSYHEVVADAGKQAGWTHGEWEYENMSLKELQALLFNYYNIRVIARGTATQHLVANANMNFTNRQAAEDIVNIFCITAGCHYKWQDHTTVEIY
jgi:transmembrane sensor